MRMIWKTSTAINFNLIYIIKLFQGSEKRNALKNKLGEGGNSTSKMIKVQTHICILFVKSKEKFLLSKSIFCQK